MTITKNAPLWEHFYIVMTQRMILGLSALERAQQNS